MHGLKNKSVTSCFFHISTKLQDTIYIFFSRLPVCNFFFICYFLPCCKTIQSAAVRELFLQVWYQFEGSSFNSDGRNQNCFQIRSKTKKWPLGHSLDWFAVPSSMKTAGQKHLKFSLWCSAGQGETDVCNLTWTIEPHAVKLFIIRGLAHTGLRNMWRSCY